MSSKFTRLVLFLVLTNVFSAVKTTWKDSFTTTSSKDHKPLAPTSISSWSMVGRMRFERQLHTASVLKNGQVLVAGGSGVNASELYNPSQKMWTTIGSINTPRSRHTASVLGNGQVLITGGTDINGHVLSSTELFDPSTNMWTVGQSMSSERAVHTATVLSNGKVLVVGGISGYPLSSTDTAELYDPATATWTAIASMQVPRSYHTASLLDGGKVLVTGGLDANGEELIKSELYDPSTESWADTGDLLQARASHAATTLADGKVLVTGGQVYVFIIGNCELYDPSTGQWKKTGDMLFPRVGHSLSLLPNKTVLVAGGLYAIPFVTPDGILLHEAELYHHTEGLWTPTTGMHVRRVFHTSSVLTNGHILVTGGVEHAHAGGQVSTNATEIYQPLAITQTSIDRFLSKQSLRRLLTARHGNNNTKFHSFKEH